jgi:hypothetical protein
MNKKLLILLTGLFISGFSGLKGQVDFNIYADTNHIRIGEQVSVKLVLINHEEKSPEVTWPLSTDTLSKSIEVLELLPVDTQKYSEETIYTQQWNITSFDTGMQVVPSFQVVINGEERETEPFFIHVETVKVDTTQAIKDIKGVEDVPISILEWMKYHWKWFAAVAVLLILIFGVYLIIKNKNKVLDVEVKSNEPEIPPYDYALQRLQKLKEGKWLEQGDVKYYHASISEILREYLENAYDVPALEQTTREILRAIKVTSIESIPQKQLNRILVLSDLVKYAKEKPTAEENAEIFKLATAFIHSTKPVEEPKKSVEEEHEA